MVKQTAIDKNIEIVNDFLQAFQKWCQPNNAVKLADLAHYVDSNFSIKNNGHTLAKNAHEYFTCVEGYRSKYKGCTLTVVKDSQFICNNKVVLQFEAVFTKSDGSKQNFYKMAVATIENDKILDWQEVTHG